MFIFICLNQVLSFRAYPYTFYEGAVYYFGFILYVTAAIIVLIVVWLYAQFIPKKKNVL